MRFRQYLEQAEDAKTMRAHIPLDPEVYVLKNLFDKHGHDLRVVGGAVRDFLTHVYRGGNGSKYKPKDIDLVTPAPPDEIKAVITSQDAEEKGIHDLPIGAAFGVIAAVFPRRTNDPKEKPPMYEIATYRKDIGAGRRPDAVEYVSDATHDAKRRDLAYNALYYDVPDKPGEEGILYDYSGGQGFEDCKTGFPHFVGEPLERCREDNLRVMRYIRFLSRGHVGGPEVVEREDAKAAEALRQFASMPGVSSERIIAEFLSGLKSALDPVNYLRTLHHFGIMDRMFSNLQVNTKFQNLRTLGSGDMVRNPRIVLAYILKDNPPETLGQALQTLKFNSPQEAGRLVEGIVFLVSLQNLSTDTATGLSKTRDKLRPDVRMPDPKARESFISQHNDEMRAWAALLKLDQNTMADFTRYERTIRGTDPRFAGLQGKELGKAIKDAEQEAFVALSKKKKKR